LKDQERDFAVTNPLLVRHIFVDRDQNLKAPLLGGSKKVTVGQTSESGVAAGLTFMS
jgi:hypothetical protein